jgi:hypothetical protein
MNQLAYPGYLKPYMLDNFNQHTVDSPQLSHPQIKQVLKVTGFCGDGPDIGQALKATGLPGSGGCPV